MTGETEYGHFSLEHPFDVTRIPKPVIGIGVSKREPLGMTTAVKAKKGLPFNPLVTVMSSTDHARRAIVGILESYNSNYDVLAEAIQNSMDALEDASITKLPGPFILEITINLKQNWFSVFDTGIGMTEDQVCEAFAPSSTFKNVASIIKKRGEKYAYRGYKGVGLTFLAYGSNDVMIHTRQNGVFVKGRMKFGRKWAGGKQDAPPFLVIDTQATELDQQKRGTFVRVHLSPETRPASLPHLGATLKFWESIIRTRTAVGQVLLGREPLANIKVRLKLVNSKGQVEKADLDPSFYYPHFAVRNPPFRFLDVVEYHKKHPGVADHAPGSKRQDGLYLNWNTDELKGQMTEEQLREFAGELIEFKPHIYAFRPYHAPLWTEINQAATGQKKSHHFGAGLVLAVDRQRLADITPIEATRFELLARNIFAVVHFDGAKPDQGRKTLQPNALRLAQTAADRAVQYLANQGTLLKPAGEKTTASQRAVEKGHEDWVDNVKAHAKDNALAIPPVSYASTPVTEQDVVGLFHQFSALGLFPGMKIFATSAAHTYDCYLVFDRKGDLDCLRYEGTDRNPLGLSTDVLGPDDDNFSTKSLTLEFKNNLEGLIEEIDNEAKRKVFDHIDICVCWATIEEKHKWYELDAITEANLHERRYPGITHVLRKDGESHVIQVIMLEEIIKMIAAGQIKLPRIPG